MPRGRCALRLHSGCGRRASLVRVRVRVRVRNPTPTPTLNPNQVPPPICYCNRQPVSPPRRWERLGGHHYGCSLTGFVNALAPQGYRLVSVILNDALFVHQRHAPQVARRLPGGVLPSPEAAFAAGYRDVPGRPIHYSWNNDTNPNATSRPTSQLTQNPRPNPTLPR